MKRLVVALSALLLASPAPLAAEPFKADLRAIVYLSCGPVMGTAWKIGDDKYVTAEHVIEDHETTPCSVDGQPVTDVVMDDGLDFATFRGPKTPYKLKFRCRGYEPGETYLAVGHAFGRPYLTYQPWIASAFKQKGYRSFTGESIPGMSGGPVIDRYGKVQGIVNMRWPARSRELRDTPLCRSGR